VTDVLASSEIHMTDNNDGERAADEFTNQPNNALSVSHVQASSVIR